MEDSYGSFPDMAAGGADAVFRSSGGSDAYERSLMRGRENIKQHRH